MKQHAGRPGTTDKNSGCLCPKKWSCHPTVSEEMLAVWVWHSAEVKKNPENSGNFLLQQDGTLPCFHNNLHDFLIMSYLNGRLHKQGMVIIVSTNGFPDHQIFFPMGTHQGLYMFTTSIIKQPTLYLRICSKKYKKSWVTQQTYAKLHMIPILKIKLGKKNLFEFL